MEHMDMGVEHKVVKRFKPGYILGEGLSEEVAVTQYKLRKALGCQWHLDMAGKFFGGTIGVLAAGWRHPRPTFSPPGRSIRPITSSGWLLDASINSPLDTSSLGKGSPCSSLWTLGSSSSRTGLPCSFQWTLGSSSLGTGSP